jgi:hypothetical protein
MQVLKRKFKTCFSEKKETLKQVKENIFKYPRSLYVHSWNSRFVYIANDDDKTISCINIDAPLMYKQSQVLRELEKDFNEDKLIKVSSLKEAFRVPKHLHYNR